MAAKNQRGKRGVPISEARKAQLMKNLLPGGDNEAVKVARARRREDERDFLERFQTCDIIEFTTKFLKLSLDGYPLLELLLRCSEGLPLPAGTLKTFVEVPCDGFAVKEVEMSWPEFFALCSSGSKNYVPGHHYATIFARVGRRGTKSTYAAIKALFVGMRKHWRQYLRPSEIMVIPIIATSQDQAESIITQRCHEVLKDAGLDWLIGAMDPKLHLNAVTNDTIPLIMGTEIQAFPCNSKKVRGEAAPLVDLDEYAHFSIEGRKQDTEIRSAATGAQGQFPGYQLVMTSTPLVEEGDFYETEQLAKTDPSILAVHAPSWTAAPVLYRNNPEFYHNEFRRSPEHFHREFRAEYAKSRAPAFREEDVLACMVLAGEIPYNPAMRYGAGIDQSGLSGNDCFSLVICYYDPSRDVCGEACRRSFAISDLDLIIASSRQTMQDYHVYEVATDRYAKGYVHQALAKEGIEPIVAPPTTELCIEFRQMLAARKMELPMQHTVKLGLEQTNLVVTDKARVQSVWHPRSKQGHGDEVDARFRAAHQAVHGNYMRRRDSELELAEQARMEREEAEYNPLTHGRV